MRYLRDDEFIRGSCPMTKEEIRIMSIAKLELERDYSVLDIGAGTGSVSIQACLMCPDGSVTAVEKDIEAIEVLRRNRDRFECSNLTIIEGEAPGAACGVNVMFDAIFIGGSGGNIEDIIKCCDRRLKDGRCMVLNFITLENLSRALKALRELSYDTECIQVSISRAKGESGMLIANNPVFILKGRKVAA